jgi:hypothetical protein
MSIVGEATERKDRRRAVEDEDGLMEYIRVYVVQTDNVHDGSVIVLNAPDLPRRGDIYQTETEIDETAVCVGRTPSQLAKSGKVWEVEIVYRTITRTQQEQDPFLRAPEMDFRFDETVVPAVGTLKSTITINADTTAPYKQPYRNSLGHPVPNQPMVDRADGVLTVVRNEDAFSAGWAMSWANVVNEDDFQGAEPRQVKLKPPTCDGPKVEIVEGESVWYFPIRYKFQFRLEGWDLRYLDEGPYYRTSTSSTAPVRPFRHDGQPYIGKLDGKGRPLNCNPGFATTATASGSTLLGPYTTKPSTTQAVYLQKRHYRERTFAELTLPSQFQGSTLI